MELESNLKSILSSIWIFSANDVHIVERFRVVVLRILGVLRRVCVTADGIV